MSVQDKLPELRGVDLLRKICLHPSKSSKHKAAYHRSSGRIASPVSTNPPSSIRIREENQGTKRLPGDVFTKFLLSHPDDRPWRREPNDLPLWDARETLNNHAKLITSDISKRFCDWYRSLGGNAVIDEETVARLFEIRIPPYAPLCQPNLGRRCIAARAVNQLERRKPPEKAHLQRPSAQTPPRYEPPEELVSMQHVFEDILHLEIVRAFCEHLKQQQEPASFKPQFLVERKLLPE
ncbi:Hypothetical predicted protein [Cloeon dipterum]|uniref:Uncharacterized protein n=1 Tax=Cloeon dipterum TaxID=197152 RepID=A0A8S1DLX0_9INSE|nr:Hypothetical predicted protein [Cloeon dipterum]